MSEENPGYYAIIPAYVRYDKTLIPNAKLLYGEITALCNKKGYCWATNSYFAELYGVSEKSISRWISQLKNRKHIRVFIEYKDGGKEIVHRYIQIWGEGVDKKEDTPMDKKVKDNTTINNNTVNTIQYPPSACASAPAETLQAALIEIGNRPNPVLAKLKKTGGATSIDGFDPLYRTLWDSFLAITPRFSNYGKEGKACHALLKAIRNLSPKAPEDAAKAILGHFQTKRNGSDKFWKGQPFTPSGLLPLVDRIVADLQAGQGKEIDPEVLEGVRF